MSDDLPVKNNETKVWGMKEDTFCMLLHLSQLTNVIGLGLILPIIMWAINKDESSIIDEHGKNVMNWIISSLIYILISFVLTFIVIGFFALFIIAVLSIIFPIMGAINANDGKVWKYPLTIQFIK